MLEQLVLAGGGAAVFAGGYTIARAHPCRFQLGSAGRRWVTADGHSMRPDPEEYLPDTGELARQILMAMRRLGHTSITQPVRALAPRLHITGTEADISCLIDFEQTILADIKSFVRANGQRYRLTLASRPRFTYSVAAGATPGVLRFTGGRPQRTIFPGGVTAAAKPYAKTGNVIHGIRWNRTQDAASTNYPSRAAMTKENRLWPPSTRRGAPAGDTSAARADSGSVRLFRVGGGNVYHLAPGANLAGRDPERCDIVLGFDDAVSAVHAEITVHDGGTVTVRDLRSSNGTALDGRLIADGPAAVGRGSVLTIGTTRLRLVVGNSPIVPTAGKTSRRLLPHRPGTGNPGRQGHSPSLAAGAGTYLTTDSDG